MLLAITLSILMFAPDVAADLAAFLRRFIAAPHMIPLDRADSQTGVWQLVSTIGSALLPILALLWSAGLISNLIQHKPVFSAHKMKPELSKISLIKGVKRQFSMRAVMEFAKGIAKIAIVGAVSAALVLPRMDILPLVANFDPVVILPLLREIAIVMLVGVLAVISVIAAADMLFQRYKHAESLRMTKQEVKDEHKQTEGDPLIKQRLRAIRMERGRRRMMAAVPKADVVITNPTHFAVALKYDPPAMAAPVLVAKGQGEVALRIREVAELNDVPLVENPPLARALHAAVDLDQEIPVEHYKAVAEIIGYVMRLRGKLAPRTAIRPPRTGQRRQGA
jgi:flagellar biosynthetic protein FlhB